MNDVNEDVYAFDALGTHWVIVAPKSSLSIKVKTSLTTEVKSFEASYSRFLPDSLLTKLNQEKKMKNPPPELVRMLRFAIEMYQKSHGLFNISVGARLEQLGYGSEPDSSAHISENLPQDIAISDSTIEIAQHIRLDFGGFGKGWLVDTLHELLAREGVKSHIVNGGGDIRVGDKDEKIWIADPRDSSKQFGITRISSNSAFAASSTRLRVWQTFDGAEMTHIVHPLAETINNSVMCAVAANTCVEADVVATSLLLAPLDHRDEIAHALQANYLVVNEDETITRSRNFPFDVVMKTGH